MAMKKRTDILIPIGIIAVLAALVLTIFLGFQRQNWIRKGEQLTAEVSAAIPKQAEAGIADGTGEVIPVLEIDGTDCAGLLSFPEYEKSWAVGSPYTDINLCILGGWQSLYGHQSMSGGDCWFSERKRPRDQWQQEIRSVRVSGVCGNR